MSVDSHKWVYRKWKLTIYISLYHYFKCWKDKHFFFFEFTAVTGGCTQRNRRSWNGCHLLTGSSTAADCNNVTIGGYKVQQNREEINPSRPFSCTSCRGKRQSRLKDASVLAENMLEIQINGQSCSNFNKYFPTTLKIFFIKNMPTVISCHTCTIR